MSNNEGSPNALMTKQGRAIFIPSSFICHPERSRRISNFSRRPNPPEFSYPMDSNSVSMILSIRRFSFPNLERAPKCFIHGLSSGVWRWSFSFSASTTKSRSVCPWRAATAFASRRSVSGRSTVVFTLAIFTALPALPQPSRVNLIRHRLESRATLQTSTEESPFVFLIIWPAALRL
jgi:hypothetical protein